MSVPEKRRTLNVHLHPFSWGLSLPVDSGSGYRYNEDPHFSGRPRFPPKEVFCKNRSFPCPFNFCGFRIFFIFEKGSFYRFFENLRYFISGCKETVKRILRFCPTAGFSVFLLQSFFILFLRILVSFCGGKNFKSLQFHVDQEKERIAVTGAYKLS